MISRIHQKLGPAGFVIAIIALVAAMSGGAYAALSASDKKLVKKEAKKWAKKYAKAGPPGANGAAGAPGAKGDAGAPGANGTNGTNGKSVVVGTATAGQCPAGGKTVEVEGSGVKNPVCNGTTGFTDTLPSGKTETGTWGLGTEDETSIVSLSFNIPLKEAPEALHFVNEAGEEETAEGAEGSDPVTPPVNCLGSAEEPKALPGHVCVYEGTNLGGALGFFGNEELADLYTSGATFAYSINKGQVATGTWAVTAK